MSIPRPTTEDECAFHCQYAYTKDNVLNYKLVDKQEKAIRKYVKGLYLSPNCGCKIENRRKCYSIKCENRCYNIACGNDCGPQCCNNPWYSTQYGFVAGKKTYLVKYEDKGAAIFAHVDIEEDEFIGEYTGRVRNSTFRFNDLQSQYTMGLGGCDQIICGQGIGSIVTRINHSCKPNCLALTYVHENRYKVVIVAGKKILKDEELTFDYKWTYIEGKEEPKTRCLCGHGPSHFIEKPAKATDANNASARSTRQRRVNDDDDQKPFAAVMLTNEMQSELDQSLLRKERPAGYYEDHVFAARDEVYIIISNNNGVLQPTGGRVLQCYTTRKKIAIIVVRTNIDGRLTHHVPRWLCFHYSEDATFRLQRYSDSDKERVKIYTSGMVDSDKANKLNDRLVMDYIEDFNSDRLVNVRQVASNQFGGGTVLGMSSTLLIEQDQPYERESDLDPSDDEDNAEDNPAAVVVAADGNENREQLPGHVMVASGPDFKRANHRQVENDSGEGEADDDVMDVMDDAESVAVDANDSVGQEQVVVLPGRSYDYKYRRDFNELRQETVNEVQFNRTLQSAIENVTYLALSRIPKERGMTYTLMRPVIRRELEYLYLLAPREERHYLRYGHYHHAVEVEHPGSWLLRWCSLCRLSSTFATEHQMRTHYYRRHAIVATTYVCPRCRKNFTLPSQIRDHIDICLPSFTSTLVATVSNYILDAYADYYALKGKGNHTMYVLQPGLPHNVDTHLQQNEKRLEMDQIKLCPVDSDVEVVPVKMKIQIKHKTEMESWDDVRFVENPKAAPPLHAAQWFHCRPLQQQSSSEQASRPTSGQATNRAPAKVNKAKSVQNKKVKCVKVKLRAPGKVQSQTSTEAGRVVIDGIVFDDEIPGSSRNARQVPPRAATSSEDSIETVQKRPKQKPVVKSKCKNSKPEIEPNQNVRMTRAMAKSAVQAKQPVTRSKSTKRKPTSPVVDDSDSDSEMVGPAPSKARSKQQKKPCTDASRVESTEESSTSVPVTRKKATTKQPTRVDTEPKTLPSKKKPTTTAVPQSSRPQTAAQDSCSSDSMEMRSSANTKKPQKKKNKDKK